MIWDVWFFTIVTISLFLIILWVEERLPFWIRDVKAWIEVKQRKKL